MSPLVTANLRELPDRRDDWTVTVEPPGLWLRVGVPRDRQLVAQWRRAARLAVRAAGVPRLRTVDLTVEIRLDLAKTFNVDLWLPTAQACAYGLGDACGCIHRMVNSVPAVMSGTVPAASLAGEVVLHITGEPR